MCSLAPTALVHVVTDKDTIKNICDNPESATLAEKSNLGFYRQCILSQIYNASFFYFEYIFGRANVLGRLVSLNES